MKFSHPSLTQRCQSSRSYVALNTESRTPADMEELYWFAVALTGDPEFAARLVVDTGKLTAIGRGIFTD